MSDLKACQISCTDDGGIVLRPIDPRDELRIEECHFDSVRAVVGPKGNKEVILYPDPEKAGPGITYLGEYEVGK